jgi:uncharacterized protein YcfJ
MNAPYYPGFNVQEPEQQSFLGFDVRPVQHDNQWMEMPGQIAGSLIGNYFAPGIGGMIGGKAGGAFGGALGDAIAGNWSGVGQDFLSTLPPEVMSLLGLRF